MCQVDGRMVGPIAHVAVMCPVAAGWFSPRAEVTNGRAAMLGFGTLLLMEHSSGVCFF